MGAYAFWLATRCAKDTGSPSWWRFVRRSRARRGAVEPSRTLVVADFEPDGELLGKCLGGVPRAMVLPGPPHWPQAGILYRCFRTATNPIEWDASLDKLLGKAIDTVAFFLPDEEVHGRTLLRLYRRGVRRVLLLAGEHPRLVHPLVQAACCKLAALGQRLRVRLGRAPAGTMTVDECRAVLAHTPQRRPPPRTDSPLRIVHFVNSLNSGGAERQACYAARAQQHAGHHVRLLLRQAAVGADGHYRYLLRPHGPSARRIGATWQTAFLEQWRRRGLSPEPFLLLPPELRRMVIDLAGDLLARPADVLHAYVDDCNTVGVLAACLAGTPAVVLSLRNGHPGHFPGLLRPWMRACYAAVLGRPGVRFVSNSAAGARDYEQWLGLPSGSIPVIRNAFYPLAEPEPLDVLRWRRQQGIAPEVPVLAGVFRLMPEKRPLFFLECVDRLRREVPSLQVLLAGVGCLEAQVRAAIDRRQLAGTVRLLGQRRDVRMILAASDLLLLTSDWEGTPNILLEAQHLGCVPVATDAGGSRETMLPGETGLLVGLDDVDGAVRACRELLAAPQRRKVMAVAGRRWVATQFNPAAMHRAYLTLYRQALVDSCRPRRTTGTPRDTSPALAGRRG